jgi:hypothetical protein
VEEPHIYICEWHRATENLGAILTLLLLLREVRQQEECER